MLSYSFPENFTHCFFLHMVSIEIQGIRRAPRIREHFVEEKILGLPLMDFSSMQCSRITTAQLYADVGITNTVQEVVHRAGHVKRYQLQS
jgi:hypothetical protein